MDKRISVDASTNVENLTRSVAKITATAAALPVTGHHPGDCVSAVELGRHLVAGIVSLRRSARMPAQQAAEDFVLIEGKPVFLVTWAGRGTWGEGFMRAAWWRAAPATVEQLDG